MGWETQPLRISFSRFLFSDHCIKKPLINQQCRDNIGNKPKRARSDAAMSHLPHHAPPTTPLGLCWFSLWLNPTYENYPFYTRNRRGEVSSPDGLGDPTPTNSHYLWEGILPRCSNLRFRQQLPCETHQTVIPSTTTSENGR